MYHCGQALLNHNNFAALCQATGYKRTIRSVRSASTYIRYASVHPGSVVSMGIAVPVEIWITGS